MPGGKYFLNSRLVYFGLVSQRSHRAQLQLSEDVDMDGSVRSGLLQSYNKYSYFTVFTSNCASRKSKQRGRHGTVIMQSNHVLCNTF